MSPRNGRPKADNPLIIEVKARIDKETSERYPEATKTENFLNANLLINL